MSNRDIIIEELRRAGHTGMVASRLVDGFQAQLANYLRAIGHMEAATALDPESMGFAEYVRAARGEETSG